tara:strand:- start:1765 stop:1914 length:150 start_codon:yes stop_codon:yes gene_type:complete
MKMIKIDDMINSSIDPKIWRELSAIKKLKILKLASEIEKIVHSHRSFHV